MSACANAFIGGRDYIIEGVLGFHAAWLPDTSVIDTDKKINTLFRAGQVAGVQDAFYWMANGFSIQLPYYINSRSDVDKFVAFTTLEELMIFYVRDDENVDNNGLERYMQFQADVEPKVWDVPAISEYIAGNNAGYNGVMVIEFIYNGFQETTSEEE